MPPTLTLNSVTTADAVPGTAPHRVSAQTGKDKATVKFTPTAAIRGYTIRLGGTSYNTGTEIRKVGRIQPGSGLRPGAGVRPSAYSSPGGTQLTEVIDDSELGAGDGAKSLNLYGYDATGWNT